VQILAVVDLFSVLATSVRQGAAEIGARMALQRIFGVLSALVGTVEGFASVR
jgi:hypothetical protein